MAKLDAFLRSSGLRLKPDGTCQFVFETTRFIIETTTDMEEAGEFLLYCSLGELRDLTKNFGGSQRKLFKMLALWNEELKMEGGDDTGLLRIDSSKQDPHVSFIYYGQIKNIESENDFQDLLDEFVDDALDYLDRLNNGDTEEDAVPVQRISRYATNTPKNVGSTRSVKSHSTATTVSTLSSEEYASHGNHASKGGSFHRGPPPPPPRQPPSTSEFGSLNNNTTSQEKNKKSVFSKVISTLQKKNDPTVTMAFIDPSNPTAAFVVDKTVANSSEEYAKPKLVISRKGAEKKGASFHDGCEATRHQSTRTTQSFHNYRSGHSAKRSSLSDVHDNGRCRRSTTSKRSSQPSIGEESYGDSFGKKSASFYDNKRPSMSDEPDRKTKSFHYNDKSRRSSVESEFSDRIEKGTSNNASLNMSIDVFNNSEVYGKPNSGNFIYSEPVLSSHHKTKQSGQARRAKTRPENHQLDCSNRSSHSQSSSHRRKTITNDTERPRLFDKHRRGAMPFEDKVLKSYYERHNAYPPPPPPRNGSKWCMEDHRHSDEESDEYSNELYH